MCKKEFTILALLSGLIYLWETGENKYDAALSLSFYVCSYEKYLDHFANERFDPYCNVFAADAKKKKFAYSVSD